MGAPAKFLFDIDFAAPKTSERAPSRQEIAQQVAEAEARAYRAGFDAALRPEHRPIRPRRGHAATMDPPPGAFGKGAGSA